jgi:ADP-ribosylglycohydrolase
MYRAALDLYERAKPYLGAKAIPPMVNASIVVGRWDGADVLLDELRDDEPDARMCRSRLAFVRGDFAGALEEIELVLQSPAAKRAEVLIQIADIHLYFGELSKAADAAVAAAQETEDATLGIRCTGMRAASKFFSGDVEAGDQLFVDAMKALSSQPIDERDRTVYTTILGNLGQVKEIRQWWDLAKQLHEEALVSRREVSDARGELQSLHAIARCELGRQAFERAEELIAEARRLATLLGERLEEGKLDHTEALLALAKGQPRDAVRRATAALRRFRESRVAYDTANARFTLAAALTANGSVRRSVEEAARARVDATRHGYGLLTTLYPQFAYSYPERIEAGLIAYACGDAFGLPWEGVGPEAVDAGVLTDLPATKNWASGETSDDTALTLLVAKHLATTRDANAQLFAETLITAAPSIRGMGPSTTAAIEQLRTTGRSFVDGGTTNGAVMRSLPIGWAMPLDDVEARREWTIALSRVTHNDPNAMGAACVGAACAAWALEGASPELLLVIAREEAVGAARACGADARLAEMLDELAAGSWQPNPTGVTLDPCDTFVTAMWCIAQERELAAAMNAAVRAGGDTDTTAAIVGGLLGCTMRRDDVEAALPWHERVAKPEQSLVAFAANGLADLRLQRASV